MSIATYAELQSAVATWLARADLTANVPDLIALGEQRMFHGSADPVLSSEPVRVQWMETEDAITLDAATVVLPDGFLAARRLYIDDGVDRTPLAATAPDRLLRDYPSAATGRPRAFAIEGASLRLGPEPNGSYAGKLLYYKKPDPLATTATNAVLTNAPALYLYAALLEAQPFIMNDERLSVWARLYAAACSGLMRSDGARRWSGGVGAVRADVGGNP